MTARIDTVLRERLPTEWDSEIGRVEVDAIHRTDQGHLRVLLRDTGFPVDPDGYVFTNPPLGVRGAELVLRRPNDAFRSYVTDAAIHYATHPLIWGCTTLTAHASSTGDTNDGHIYSKDATYANARAGTGATLTAATNATGQYQGQALSFGNYEVYELFFSFDTSSIGTDNVDDATLSVYMPAGGDYSQTNFVVQARLLSGWSSSGLTTADYVPGADQSGDTLLATKNTTGGLTAGYIALTSESAFVSNVNKTGNTELYLGSDRTAAGTTPTQLEYVYWYMADRTGTAEDPKLVVNHSVSAVSAIDPFGTRGFFGA